MIVLGIILAILTGLMNRLRGGALNDYLATKNKGRVSHTITRLLLSLFALISFYTPIIYNIGFDIFESKTSIAFISGTFLSIYIIGLLPGWGTYFDLGNTERDFVDHREVLWIDWVLYKIFGAIWIPDDIGTKTNFEKQEGLEIDYDAFDLKFSPTGKIRPKEWRQKRDFLGMSLRGLHFYIPSTIVIFAHLLICFDVKYWGVLFIIPFGLLFGAIYKISQKLDFDNFMEKIKLEKYSRHFQGYTQRGEFITGALLLSAIPFFILLILG